MRYTHSLETAERLRHTRRSLSNVKAQKPLTEDQAKLIRELSLDPKTVTFEKQGAVLPCRITIHTEGGVLRRWLYRDEKTTKLKLGDEKPVTSEPRRKDEPTDDEVIAAESLELEKAKSQKPKLFESNAPSYNPTTLETDLLQRGFSEREAKAIVAQVCDGDTIREAAQRIGMSHGWVGRKRIQRVVKSLRKGMPLTAATAATGHSTARHLASVRSQETWTLPKARDFAREQVADYLPRDASDPVYLALGFKKLLPSGNQSVAERLAAFIRLNPRSLLDPKNGNRLVGGLVDFLEAAHFKVCEHRFAGLLPKANLKLAAATARRALRLLCSGSRGNPSGYPTEILAEVVGIMQLALVRLHRAWRDSLGEPVKARLKMIRDAFGAEVEVFDDAELQSFVTNNLETAPSDLLKASARLAEKATQIAFKSFIRAWNQEPSLHEIYQDRLHQ